MKTIKENPNTARDNMIFLLCVLGVMGFFVWIGTGPWQGSHGATSTPNLYELTRQTAENTRHIFWLIAVCFTAWSFRSYKTGK